MLLGFLAFGLCTLLGASESAGGVFVAVGLGAGLLLGPLVAWRSYRRRSATEFRVWPDRVEFVEAGGRPPIALANEEVEVLSILMPEPRKTHGYIEIGGAGKRIQLNEVFPIAAVARDLGRSLLPSMVERAARRLEAGETIEFKVPLRSLAWPAVGALVSASMLAIVAGEVVRRWGTLDAVKPKAAAFAFLLLAGLVAAISLLRRRWRSGVVVSKTGLLRPGQDFGAETPWSSISSCEVGAGLVELTSDLPPETFRLPVDAPNALVLRGLAERLRPPA